ncbi:hypothetical protein R3X25_00355 [Lutibacter sp. TH_r2]|uniref:hypothetical protein n=1 Tax=Lutibacter sp. TH_r2 TaxID=3082083 RepID=UPI002953EF61|nr:hypothetical protein [Lutibacter sp. TH_r2]MDV7185715.1 hypothetical protein [Lutibacter sp. TH_r2]
MEELDLLKKDWKKKESTYPKLSFDEIYNLIHKKSSSIVKWLLIICIAELVFWSALNLFFPDSSFAIFEEFNLMGFLKVTYIIYYLVLFGFIYLFYRNYKAISVTDTTKKLMNNILKTRKTVKYYIIFNIAGFIILSVLMNTFFLINPEHLLDFYREQYNISIDINPETFVKTFIIIQVITIIIASLFIWVFYRIIYGILIKRLKKNYKELASLEI